MILARRCGDDWRGCEWNSFGEYFRSVLQRQHGSGRVDIIDRLRIQLATHQLRVVNVAVDDDRVVVLIDHHAVGAVVLRHFVVG